MAEGAKEKVGLGGVPETLLATLYYRSIEARRPDALLHDPKAVELVDAIDYPFEQRFGSGDLGRAQGQALRVRCFDLAVERFLTGHPDGTVVALGEGLETQFWRVDNGRVGWLTVDLPEPSSCAAASCRRSRGCARWRARRSTSGGWTRSTPRARCW
jgi:O-methyltransferase involved in polyketide biosynthesis